MSFVQKGRPGYSRKLICAAYTSVAVVSLSGQVSPVQAAVFEQACNGKIIALGDGAPTSAPSQQTNPLVVEDGATSSSVIEFGTPASGAVPDVPTGDALAADLPRPSSLCSSAPVGAPSNGVLAIKAIQQSLSLPAPNRLSQSFTDKQLQVRQLVAKVGARFAGTPGVRKAKLDEPAFVKLFTTLVQRESNFYPKAVSPVGARGLGQLMPQTARNLGVKDAFAPEDNLVGAATYLTDMLDQFGSPELALAAYNAGPGAVTKYRGIPPYRETRQYVADIFHEVLRDPAPIQAPPALSGLARRGLAAFAADNSSSNDEEGPFSKVLAEKAQPLSGMPSQQPLAFTQSGDRLSGDVSPRSKTVLESSENMQVGPSTAGRPSPDLSSLPEPREFGDAVLKSQLAMRELAADTAMRHAKAPGVKAAGLSEEAFVTLFVALIRRESSFNPRAVSPDGAKGLGQLMPDAIRMLGVKDPFAADENLNAGATRLTKLLEQFASPALALAAYNAGEDAMTDRAVIPAARDTRQLIADVLYDVKSNPLPDFVVTRFPAAGRADLAQTGKPTGDDLAFAEKGAAGPP